MLANDVSDMTLRPCKGESVNFDTTKNLYIEGDNLEVLKILRESYLHKVKMIYIDPPYNTGSDFVYNDKFTISKEEYASIDGESDDSGNRLVENRTSNGRFHSDWLNMIYPRLILANDFLSSEGVVFISIDDHELDNLVRICKEIFGEGSFVATIPWRKRTAKSDVPFGISQDYEWIVCFAKSDFKASVEGKGRKYYETIDLPGRPWRYHDLTTQKTASERPNSFFTIVNPKTGEEYPADPNRTWRITSDTIKSYIAQDRIIFPGDYDFLRIAKPVLRYFKEDDMEKDGADFGRISVSTKLPDDIGLSGNGTQDILNIFGNKVFSFPKPVSLIKYLITIAMGSSKEGIVMDFFAGSSTTAVATMEYNLESGAKLSFITVQLPEDVSMNPEASSEGFDNICDIGKERIRRFGDTIEGNTDCDVGFRVFKLDSSNMNDVFYDPGSIRKDILDYAADNIKSDRSGEDLLIQVMMESDSLLSDDIQEDIILGKKVYNVNDGYVIACFDLDISDEVVMEIAKRQPRFVAFRDSSMASDAVAINYGEIFKTFSPSTHIKVL